MLRKLLFLHLGALLLMTQGCGPAALNLEALGSMKKVALVSVTLDKVGQGPENDPIQQQAVDYAADQYRAEFAALPQWQLVPAPAIDELDREFSDLASSKIAAEVLLDLANRNQLPGDIDPALMMKLAFASLSKEPDALEGLKGELIASTVRDLQADLDSGRGKVASAAGFPFVPYRLSDDDGKWKALATIRTRVLSEYCRRHGLDGVLVVHQASDVGTPGDIRVIVQDNRVLSSLKVNPVLIVREKDGQIVYNSGAPRLDDLAPMKLAMPIYTGEKDGRGMMQNFKLNLNDPKGVSLAGYKGLVDKTSKKIVAKFVNAQKK